MEQRVREAREKEEEIKSERRRGNEIGSERVSGGGLRGVLAHLGKQ